MQLKAALDVAVQYELADASSELLAAIEINKQAPPALRFQSAIVATGLASDEAVLSLLDTIKGNRGYGLQARYHRARALERLGRNTEASSEYRNVVQLDNTATPYYGMWAGLRLKAISEPEGGAERASCSGAQADGRYCPSEARQGRGLGEGLVAPPTGAEITLTDAPDLELQDAQRQAILGRLAPLVAAHGAAYPWLARAADLVKLDLFEDAADEVGETYLAYRDAKGTPRFRSGVDAVLTGAVPARHMALGTLRRDRLALGPMARGELASIADLLGDPGVSLRLRDEHREVRPRAYSDAVEVAAAKYGVDPNLLFAVMRVESIYHRQIVSYAGAVGLMQIMPRTGMLISRELGVEDFDVIDLLDPRTNLEFAAWYLSSLIKRFDGRLPLAIASYNGGPHNVRLWMSGYPKEMPLDAFLERIPFDQTHRYVRRVLTHYAAYRAQKNLPMTDLSVALPPPRADTLAF
jgi:soluble lytic murein transglycosylase